MDSEFKNTLKLLHSISARLSGRHDCKDVEYVVKISENQEISVEPNIYVYPNRHSRSRSDKEHVLHHVLMNEFTVVSVCVNDNIRKETIREPLIPGTYEYKSSINRKRRRWVRRYKPLRRNMNHTCDSL